MYECVDDLTEETQAALVAAARDGSPVRGLTHGFYKYPARFSPVFASAAIKAFTQPGDLVLDPHVGGGTTLVEALACGREAVGVDISSLAEFITNVKCTVYSEAELETLEAWSRKIGAAVDIHRPSTPLTDYEQLGYYKHLDHPSRWRFRKAIEQSIAAAIKLGTPRLEAFGRCVVLRSAQWALDGRSKRATIDGFRRTLEETADDMVNGARNLRRSVRNYGRQQSVTILRRSAIGLHEEPTLTDMRAPRLVVTSPPYPGVHVLYHRWQVDGRKEAPLPFMIANKLDGAGLSYYTMGDRKYPGLKTYFDNITGSMSSVAALADHDTVVVQMVAFSSPDWQLPRYLEAMEASGLAEMRLPVLKGDRDGRLWRSVPGRRWYSAQRGTTPGSQEVVLFHRKVRQPSAASAAVSDRAAR
ncbi:DNA methyltransferase [Bradyrhizobium cytisi]|uniref:site-specific DNA-methyltransferase (adenine-specific) n=1 Tax=Bradyrhizobium cytisi TaxID=515489 RepID=A0A5S4W8H5_9BRAD|nr:DNA methyltransferase [Bradyrhizobium cytisi]TYL76754.1 site-specific DNA-methyltransferase [Bradyrhizobium cytisi]